MTDFTLNELARMIAARATSGDETSYTRKLVRMGIAKIAQKVGEEAVETVIEGIDGKRKDLAAESADLLYHLLVLWAARDLDPSRVWAALARREGISGIEEKKGRKDD